MVDYGQYDQRITLQSLGTEQDEFGETVPTWFDVCTLWADVQAVSGREYFAAQQTNAEISHRVRVRYWPQLKPTQRILWGSKILDIQAILDSGERHRELTLMCIERNPEGA